MKKFITILLISLLTFMPSIPVLASSTADVTVTATPAYINISVSPNNYNFGVVQPNASYETPTTQFTVTNSSSVNINVTISVTSNSWGGNWNHSDTGQPGTNAVALKAKKYGNNDWIVVKYNNPNKIVENHQAGQSFQFGLQLLTPTQFEDGQQKQNTVRLTATQA